MQLPSVDRTPHVRPTGADAASSGANRVIPVAPVNPSTHANEETKVQPGVVDMVNPALKMTVNEKINLSVPDPVKGGLEAAAPRDWTIHRPPPEKVENPPPKPISQVLMDHLKTMWTASASAIQIEQVSNQLTEPPPVPPAQAPGELAKQILLYKPSKINKTENL